jgi:hypothetical protein
VDAIRLPPGWSLQIMRSIGVPFWPLLIAWESLYTTGSQRLNIERDDQNQSQNDYYSGIVFLLDEWASTSRPDQKSQEELRVSANSGNLFDKIRTWKHELERLRFADCLEALEKIEGLLKGTLYNYGF